MQRLLCYAVSAATVFDSNIASPLVCQDGGTALVEACRGGHLHVVQWLMETVGMKSMRKKARASVTDARAR
jgi:hypothetical protein